MQSVSVGQASGTLDSCDTQAKSILGYTLFLSQELPDQSLLLLSDIYGLWSSLY